MTVTITLPVPSAKLHSHNKGCWWQKVGPTKSLKELAFYLALQQKTGDTWQSATIAYRFYFPDLIHRDAANAIQSMKPAVDGVVKSGLIAGDNWRRLRIVAVECDVDRENPRTELEFTKVEDVRMNTTTQPR